MPPKILSIVGTRPEVIKMAPVILALRAHGLDAPILVTGQHRELLDQMLQTFDLQADWDLDLMRPNQDLATLTGHLIPGIARILKEAKPAVVLAQGDTSTVFCAALAAYYEGIPFGHVTLFLKSKRRGQSEKGTGLRRRRIRWRAPSAQIENGRLLGARCGSEIPRACPHRCG